MPDGDDTLYRRAFHSLPDAMTISRIDDGVIEDANQGFLELTGFCRDEVIGRSAVDIGLYANPSERSRLVREVLVDGKLADHTVEVVTKCGDRHMTHISAAIVPDEGDIRLFAVGRVAAGECCSSVGVRVETNDEILTVTTD